MEFTGRSGGVTSVTAGDASITVGGTAAAPTIAVSQSFAFAWTAAQSWTVDDANRATNTDILTITHTTTSGLFGAANMSVGILMRLEDNAGNTANAGRMGFKWLDPSSISLDSAFFIDLRRANGALAEQFTVGSGSTTGGMTYSRDGAALAGTGMVLDAAGSVNGDMGIFLRNRSSGNGADGSFTAANDQDDQIHALVYSSGVAGSQFGVTAARQSSVYTTGSSPLTVGTIGAFVLTLGTSNTGRWQVSASGGDFVPFLNDTYDIGSSALRVMDVWTGGRVHFAKGADVASANDMTLGGGGISFDITGATQINTIATTNYQAGDIVILQFDGAPTVKNLTAGTGAQIELAASADFTASAGDELGLKYNGTYWREIFRTVI